MADVTPHRRTVGAALDAKGTTYLRMRCMAQLSRGTCGVLQEDPRANDMSERKQLAESICMWCGSIGQMTKER